MNGIRRILATVLVASLSWPYSPAHAVFPPKTIFVDGQPFTLTQEKNSRGRVTKEILVSPNYSEILIDADGDGVNELWEVAYAKEGITITARAPYQGEYSRIEVEQRRKNGFVTLVFGRQRATGSYDLISSGYQPYGYYSAQGQGAEEIVYAGKGSLLCRYQDAGIHEEAEKWRAILDRLTGGKSGSEKKLKCLLDRYEKTLFEPSCFSDRFVGSLNDMKSGVAEILASVYTKTDSSNGTRASYLQCLNENGLNTHAARIQREFNQIFSDITRAVAEDSVIEKFGHLSAEEFCAQMKPLPEPVKVLKTYKPFTCFVDNGSSDMARYYDDYKQIAFLRPKNQLEKPANYTDAHTYASFAFHEMLHMSKIANEDLTYSIQWCCGDKLPPDSPPCKRMGDILEDNRTIEIYETAFGMETEDYWDFRRDEIDRKFGSGLGNTFMNDYFQTLDEKSRADQEKLAKCLQSTASQQEKQACNDVHKKRLAELTKEYFADPSTCKAFVRYAQVPNQIDCAAMGSKLASLILKMGDPPSSVPIPARKPSVIAGGNGDSKPQTQAPGTSSPVGGDVGGASSGAPISHAATEQSDDRSGPKTFSQPGVIQSIPATGSENVRDQASDRDPSGNYSAPGTSSSASSRTGSRRRSSSSSFGRSPASSPKMSYNGFNQSDVASRVKRSTPVYNAAKAALGLVSDAVLPARAEAAPASASSDMGGGHSSHSRGTTYVSPEFRALANKNVDLGKVSLGNPFSGMASAQSGNGSTVAKSSGAQVTVSPPSGGGSASEKASVQAKTSTEVKPDMPGGKSAKSARQAASADGPATSEGAALGSKKSAVQPENEGRVASTDEFVDSKKLRAFLLGGYDKVWARLNSPERWVLVQALVDPKNRIRIVDHRGTKHGSDRPSVEYIYCDAKRRLALPKDCN